MINRSLPPKKIVLHKISKKLEVVFADLLSINFSATWLRLNSPSADNKGARNIAEFSTVSILGVERIGNYAIKLLFSDGHSTGIYSWENLRRLGEQYKE